MAHSIFVGAEGAIEKIPFVLVSDERWAELQQMGTSNVNIVTGGTFTDACAAFHEICPIDNEVSFISYLTQGLTNQLAQRYLDGVEGLFGTRRTAVMANAPTQKSDLAFQSETVKNWAWSNNNHYWTDLSSSDLITQSFAMKLPLEFAVRLNNNGNLQVLMSVIPEGMIGTNGHLNFSGYAGQKFIKIRMYFTDPSNPDTVHSSDYIRWTTHPGSDATQNQLFVLSDFTGTFGTYVQENVNIVKGEPGPTPGEALPTEPGQPDNDTDNTGGLGENIGDAIEYPTTPFGATGMGSITYLLDYLQFEKVLHSFYDPTIFTTLTELTMNSVISVNLWPMVLSGQSADYGGVIIGNTPISFSGLGTGHTTTKQVQPNDLYTYNFGTISIPKNQYYGGFLDYEPYTSIQIYLPYCGIQTIKAHDVIGHSITLYVTCDLFTGTGQYALAVDYQNKNGGTSYAIKYKWPCMVSQPIKITGSNMATLQQALTQNAGQFIKGITSNPASLISGTIGALHDTLSGQQQMASSQGDSLDRYLPQTPYLMITRPNTVVPNDYNKNFGRPSLKTMTLNDLVGKGFTTVPNPLLDLSCTEEEKNYITNALQKGVYL